MNDFEIRIKFEASADDAERLLEKVAHILSAAGADGTEGDTKGCRYEAELRDLAAGSLIGAASHGPPFVVELGYQAPEEQRRSVVAALLAFGDGQRLDPQKEPSFVPDPEANRFVLSNPFAFLLGVIFDEAIVAEKAWAAPYELYRRLGHLDPGRIASEPEPVAEAVARRPALHRYIKITPARIVHAAQRVLAEYGGDAFAIWADEPTAADLKRRFEEFDGIGQKKAAMAVEILYRDLGVPISAPEGTEIAYDIHVRRVFLRSGLAKYDDLDHMIEIARQANLEHPGALDLPAWLIGRQWCRAGIPDCPECALTEVCPKLVERGSLVRGV
jgi:uncharacterized HhH-GPD family protein